MQIKKARGRIFGADFSSDEQKAINIEIMRQLAEYDKAHATEIKAMILWQLCELYGFGEKRLRRFHDNFDEEMSALLGRYEMGDPDKLWLCTKKLKERGIDISQWGAEE